MIEFKDREGNKVSGRIVKQYRCFEGHMRYIFEDVNGRQYRCIENENGEYEEEVI